MLGLYWWWSGRRIKSATRQEPQLARFAKYWLPLLLAGALLGPGEWFGDTVLHSRYMPETTTGRIGGLAVQLCGVFLACWSRHVLGRNWSLAVTLKQEHELIQSGPYAWVRHPIYTGLITAFLGTAIMIGEWRALLSVVILSVSFWCKLRIEERWLREEFGDRYIAYAARTKALVPGTL